MQQITSVSLSANNSVTSWELRKDTKTHAMPLQRKQHPIAKIYSIVSNAVTTQSATEKDDAINETAYTSNYSSIANCHDEELMVLRSLVPPLYAKEKTVLVGSYEGGFKVWEGTWDLISYIFQPHIQFKHCKVLELGCGHGLPGVVTIHKGASEVVFQDLNEAVLRNITLPNVLLNTLYNPTNNSTQTNTPSTLRYVVPNVFIRLNDTLDDKVSICSHNVPNCTPTQRSTEINRFSTDAQGIRQNPKTIRDNTPSHIGYIELKKTNAVAVESSLCHFVNFDWKAVGNSMDLPEEWATLLTSFDYILCSEGIYRTELYPFLVRILHSYLKVGGVAVFASKRYYFGLGGGSLAFKEFVSRYSQCCPFSSMPLAQSLVVTIVHSFNDSLSNIRDILVIQKF